MSGRDSKGWQDQLEEIQEGLRSKKPTRMLSSYKKPPPGPNDSNRYRKKRHTRNDAEQLFEIPLSAPSIQLPENPTSPDAQVQQFVTLPNPQDNERGQTVFNNEERPSNREQAGTYGAGTISLKTSSGEIQLPVKEEEREVLVQQAIRYNEANISKEKANFFAVAATAVFTAFSSAAIGVSIARMIRGKKKTDLLDIQ